MTLPNTFAAVEERLVEAAQLWRRSPGGGRWPFAGDAPWHLMVRETVKGDYDARGGDMESAPAPRPLPLSRAQVARRDEASAWLMLAPERDRRLLVLGIAAKVFAAASGERMSWAWVLKKMGEATTTDALRQRYSRAMTVIVQALARATEGGPVSSRVVSDPANKGCSRPTP